MRIENSIKALAQVSELHVYSRLPFDEIGGAKAAFFYQRYCTGFHFGPYCAPSERYKKWARAKINQLSQRTIGRNCFRVRGEDYRHFLKKANELHPDVLWLGYGNISYPLLKFIKLNSRYKVVVDTDSVWSSFLLRGLPYANTEIDRRNIETTGKEKREEERWGTKLADVTTAVSEVDATYYRALARNGSNIHVFANVIDLGSYAIKPAPPPGFQHNCIYLAGSFWPNSPMEHAARWVIDQVLPRVRQSIPDLHFYIVGKGSEQALTDINDPAITITGQVSSVLPYLCHARVALTPLWFESGTRFKILEAGACGIPVVSTSLGAEGIQVTNEQDILIADNPEQFAAGIVRILTDHELATRLGVSLKKLVEARYSLNRLVQEGRSILNHLISTPTSTLPE